MLFVVIEDGDWFLWENIWYVVVWHMLCMHTCDTNEWKEPQYLSVLSQQQYFVQIGRGRRKGNLVMPIFSNITWEEIW